MTLPNTPMYRMVHRPVSPEDLGVPLTFRGLGVSGPAGVGKSTLAGYLADITGGEVVSFATPLKAAARLLGWDGGKDDRGRVMLQKLGQVMRGYDPETWIRLALQPHGFDMEEPSRRLHGGPYFIDDMRFPNEASFLAVAGFGLVRMMPNGFPLYEGWRRDESEVALDETEHDFYVRSVAGDLALLRQSAAELASYVST